MENYTRVPKQKDQESISPNEIRITSTGKTRRYISYGVALLDPTLLQQDDEDDKEQKEQRKDQQVFDFIVLKGMGQAINKTVTIAEVIKRRVANLHQLNEIHSTTITDEWEPNQEGLEKQSTTRTVSAISITLSKTALNVNDPGYQAPISADLIQPMQPPQPRKKKSTEEKEEKAPVAEEQGEEAAKKIEKKKKKKKPLKKKKQPAEKSEEATTSENKTEAKDDKVAKPKTEKAEKTEKTEKTERAPKKKRAPAVKTEQSAESNEEQSGAPSTRGSGSRGRGRGRGGRRYRGGYKQGRTDGGNEESSNVPVQPQTE